MKNYLVAVITVFHLVTTVIAGKDSNKEFTKKFFATNGKAWVEFPLEAKVYYFMGMMEGKSLFHMAFLANGKLPEQEVTSTIEKFDTKGMTIGELVESVDLVYKDPSNRNIPVAMIYGHIILKHRGESQNELNKNMADLRKAFNQ